MQKDGKLENGNQISVQSEQSINVCRIIEIIEIYLNTINQMIIGTVTFYLTWYCLARIPDTLRLLHVWLCMIGYHLLMAEAILTFYHANSWSRFHSRRTKSRIHWVLQVTGTLMSVVGCGLEYSHHKRAHFSTFHGISGLISMIFAIVSLLNGIIALWSVELMRFIKPIYSKLFHTIFGTIGFAVGMLSIFYSYDTTTISNFISEDGRILLQIAAILTAVFSLFGAFHSLYRHIKTLLKF